MKKKDIYFRLEFFLTVFLLSLSISLLGEIISDYGLYIIIGLICGFSFSWFNRGNSRLIRTLINLAALGTFLWIIYSIINSSFFYTEVVLICLRGVFILEIILSFGASLPAFLTYLQLLSIPLFMSYPILVRGYNALSFLLILGYVICWFAILKVKLYGFFKPENKRKFLQYNSLYLLAIFSLICVFLSWMLFSKLSLGRIEKGGLLPEESMESEVSMETLEKQYYALQDEIQEEITNLILEFKSTDERFEVLALLSSLIKESPSIMEVKKAEQGLIDYLKRPGPGLEKSEGEELIIAIKNYLDRKTILNLKKAREDTMDILKNNAFNIRERISILNRINKMQHSNSYQQISKYSGELQKTINNSSVYIDAKRELKELIGKFKEWKTLEFFRKESDYLKRDIDSRDEQVKKEFADLLSGIDRTEKPEDFKDIGDKVDKLKEKVSAELKDLVKGIEKLLDLGLKMTLSEKNRELKEKLESAHLAEYKLKELKEEADALKETEDRQDFLADFSKFQEKIKEDTVNISQEMKELLEIKIHSFIKEKIEKIKDMLKDSILPVQLAKEFLREVEKLELDKKSKDVISDSKKLEADIEKFSNQGFILNETKDNLIREIEDIKELLLFKFKADEEAEGKEAPKNVSQIDYQREWEEILEESFLKEERKKILKQLTKELFKAQSTAQIENIKEAAEKEIEDSVKEGTKKEEREKLKEGLEKLAEVEKMFIIDKELSGLRKEIEQLKKTNPQEARKLEEFLRKIRESSTNEELQKELDNLKEYLKSKTQGIADYQKEWRELLERSSLKEERKEALKQLTEELFKAQTTSQVEDIKEAAQKEIEDSGKEGTKKEEAEKLKDGFKKLAEVERVFIVEKEIPGLRKKIGEEKYKSMDGELNKESKEIEEEGSWQIYILPSYLVVPVDYYVSLKTIAIYNNIFIKELGSDLEWFSSAPYIAWVDEKNTMHSLSKGKVKISAKYKGISSQEVEVIVVDKISEATDRAIKKELVK